MDYPIAPLGHDPLSGSPLRSPIFVLLITLIGLGYGLVVAFVRGYLSTIEKDEKQRLKDAKEKAKSNIRKLVFSVRKSLPFIKKRAFRD